MARASLILSPFSDSVTVDESAIRDKPISCRIATSPSEVDLHRQLREAIFVHEQELFTGTDVDEHDKAPDTLCVLGLCGDIVGGVVRLYPLKENGLWKGDRLAVLPPFRKLMLGAALVRFAVHTAGERGGDEMVAYIQVQNVRFFEHLGWHRVGEPFIYVGQPHQKMAIELRRPEQ